MSIKNPTAREMFHNPAPRTEADRLVRERNFFSRLRLANGLTKDTSAHRLDDLNGLLLESLQEHASETEIVGLDVAVSSGITTIELAEALRKEERAFALVGIDSCIESTLLSFGDVFHVLCDSQDRALQFDLFGFAYGNFLGKGLQFCRRCVPVLFARLLFHFLRLPGVRRLAPPVTLATRLLTDGWRRQPNVTFVEEDLFNRPGPGRTYHFIRACNVLNPMYFSKSQLATAVENLGVQLRPGGVMLIARTHGDGSNHGACYQLQNDGAFRLLKFIGSGCEIESILLDSRCLSVAEASSSRVIGHVQEAEPVELQRFPHPYQAAFTVASDIDSGSIPRFRAIHRLFCSRDLILEGSPEWRTLGLRSGSPWFDRERGGVPGLGLAFADSFFLVGDPTTFGMHRYVSSEDHFVEDTENGENCAALVRQWIKEGDIDSWHGFLHYKRKQIAPLLQEFFDWCRREKVAPPKVWFNHSYPVNPAGICPESLQPSRMLRLARLSLRQAIGPWVGRTRLPLRYALARYDGDTPGSPYYVNDILADNGLRYVWLNMNDLYHNQIVLPEERLNGRSTILRPVVMDDGVRYWRFERCYGSRPEDLHGESYLRDSGEGSDASHLITEKSLNELCRSGGTCILYTHWTHRRSMPIGDETIGRFLLLRQRSEAGKIWITSTSKLLEWTRRRTFLRFQQNRDGKRVHLELEGVDDPIFGRESVSLKDLHGLAFRLRNPASTVTVSISGNIVSPQQLGRSGNLCWLDAKGVSDLFTARPDAAVHVA